MSEGDHRKHTTTHEPLQHECGCAENRPMTLPPIVAENLDRFYGADSPYRIYAFIATGFLLLSFSKSGRRMGCGGVLITIVLYYIITWLGDACTQFTPKDPPKTQAAVRR